MNDTESIEPAGPRRRDGGLPRDASTPSPEGASDRLPPPAFPPGHRRSWVHRPRAVPPEVERDDETDSIPADAFYAPDEPIRRIEDPAGLEGAQVGGMRPGEDQSVTPGRTDLSTDDVADLLMELAREVRARRSGRLLWQPSSSPLEGALRGLLAGYLRHPEGPR